MHAIACPFALCDPNVLITVQCDIARYSSSKHHRLPPTRKVTVLSSVSWVRKDNPSSALAALSIALYWVVMATSSLLGGTPTGLAGLKATFEVSSRLTDRKLGYVQHPLLCDFLKGYPLYLVNMDAGLTDCWWYHVRKWQ